MQTSTLQSLSQSRLGAVSLNVLRMLFSIFLPVPLRALGFVLGLDLAILDPVVPPVARAVLLDARIGSASFLSIFESGMRAEGLITAGTATSSSRGPDRVWHYS